MPKTRKPRAIWVPPPRNAFQLRVELLHIQPPIWRRVLVADNGSLGDLHHVILVAMGWEGHHLHAFRFGQGAKRLEYGMLIEGLGDDSGVQDENLVLLSQLIRRPGQAFGYEYDFGDGWEHKIKVEKVLPFDPSLRLPVCLEGARACPPEDCGSYPGYEDVLRVLAKSRTAADRELREWVGDYDPEAFDLEAVNRRLQPAGERRRTSPRAPREEG